MFFTVIGCQHKTTNNTNVSKPRERISINENWKFMRYSDDESDNLIYDIRPDVHDKNDDKVADSKPTEAVSIENSENTLKAWILPSANPFIADSSKHYIRPKGNPGSDFAFVQANFDDTSWETVNLPHDWAIKGPFYTESDPIIGGGMGRLPVHGVAWYRKDLDISTEDIEKTIYLDIDGAMSYAIVWLNGHLVGGWPYGYNSFRLDLTPYVIPGGKNQLAIRLDNPAHSARWYPGAGIYRNVWLTKVNPIHIGHWGTTISCENVSTASADLNLSIELENKTDQNANIEVFTELYLLDENDVIKGKSVASFPRTALTVSAGTKTQVSNILTLKNPKLWGPPPHQTPHRYVAITSLHKGETIIDRYQTQFGIRDVRFDAKKGLFINNKPIRIQGVNQHHDLGALGTAFNVRAAERQLEILREMGCNAIRTAHNPPAPELLALTDKMGFLVLNEIFDNWERKKTPLDFHLIFPEWHEADTRAFIRRDKNHPSVIIWSFGNEVGEQYTDTAGAAIARRLHQIIREEDPTRPATVSMNFAKPDMPFSKEMDIINLNYQGEGIRDAPAYAHLTGIRTSPLYPAFHKTYPDRMIISSETASALSSRGTYLFPVFEGNSAPVSEGIGGNGAKEQVSAYELYTAAFGSSADKVFASQDKHPYVAGEFVWTGWDYLGEPTPYYSARSSYSGIIDLAGFKKDRFYLYQSRWRPEHPMAHILPHWNWPERMGKVTPVHVFSSGDEAELFLNGQSLGRQKKEAYEYRFRWDDVIYHPGELTVVTYKNGKQWASDTVKTTGDPYQLQLTADRTTIQADGQDLAFVTLDILDKDGLFVAHADNNIHFELQGTGKIVATDNGNPADMIAFPSHNRKAFSGKALIIIQATPQEKGTITLKASSSGLQSTKITLKTSKN